MRKPPRSAGDRLLDRPTTILALAQGFGVLGVVLAIYFVAVARGLGVDQIRTLTFVTIVIANLALICTNRSWSESILTTLGKPNKAFWWVIGGTLFFLAVAIGLPAAREIFQFAPVPPLYLLACVVGGIASVLWFEVYKLLRRGTAR